MAKLLVIFRLSVCLFYVAVLFFAAQHAGGIDGGSTRGFAPVPRSTPELPETVSPRASEQQQVLDVLLNRSSADGSDSGRVLAHGMGGLGKTTLSASIVRLKEVRQHFHRIAFVSAGQEPGILELQRALCMQLVGQPMDDTNAGTSESQREALQKAAAGKCWLVVLDDIWQAEHERALNFIDNSTAPDCKVFVTTRFSRLLPAYEIRSVTVRVELFSACEHVLTTLLLVHSRAGTSRLRSGCCRSRSR